MWTSGAGTEGRPREEGGQHREPRPPQTAPAGPRGRLCCSAVSARSPPARSRAARRCPPGPRQTPGSRVLRVFSAFAQRPDDACPLSRPHAGPFAARKSPEPQLAPQPGLSQQVAELGSHGVWPCQRLLPLSRVHARPLRSLHGRPCASSAPGAAPRSGQAQGARRRGRRVPSCPSGLCLAVTTRGLCLRVSAAASCPVREAPSPLGFVGRFLNGGSSSRGSSVSPTCCGDGPAPGPQTSHRDGRPAAHSVSRPREPLLLPHCRPKARGQGSAFSPLVSRLGLCVCVLVASLQAWLRCRPLGASPSRPVCCGDLGLSAPRFWGDLLARPPGLSGEVP